MLAPRPSERVHDVDAVRGLALLGILVVNINAFASAYYGTGARDPQFAAPLDQAVAFGVSMLFELKFYLLFSFLFGYSFTCRCRRPSARAARCARGSCAGSSGCS